MDEPQQLGATPAATDSKRKNAPPLSPFIRHAIRENTEGLSISALAKKYKVSRPTVYRWLGRQEVCEKSRKPKTDSSSMLPIQRDAIRELVRLTKLPQEKLLPSIQHVFPVLRCLTRNGRKLLWDQALGPNPTVFEETNSQIAIVSRFRVGALWLGDARNPTQLVCCLWAAEEVSGFVVHRIVRNTVAAHIDFLVDLCQEWPLPIAQITLLTAPDDSFPDLPVNQRGRISKFPSELFHQETNDILFKNKKPVPELLTQSHPSRPHVLWLHHVRTTDLLEEIAKRVVRKCLEKYNLRTSKKRRGYGVRPSRHTSPREQVARRMGFKADNPAALSQLASRPLVRYSEIRKSLKSNSLPSTMTSRDMPRKE